MKNGNVNTFLDTLFYDDHYVIYNGKKYFFNALCTDKMGISRFEIYKMDMNDKNVEIIYSLQNNDITVCAQDFITKKIFDGKSFWDVESEMTWIDA